MTSTDLAAPPDISPGEFRAFSTFDGESLFYRAWNADAPAGRALILLHRGHEHSGRWAESVARLGLPGVQIFAWDQRGHGRSPGPRGGAEHLGVITRDLDCFVKHLEECHGVDVRDTVLLAHSVGGVIAAAWVHDYAPRLRGLVLATPAFRVKLYVPGAIPALPAAAEAHRRRARHQLRQEPRADPRPPAAGGV